MAEYLRREDYDNFGTELLDVSARAAMEALGPTLEGLAAQNVALERRLAVEARRNLDRRVAELVPDYRQIDQRPDWHQWLRQPDQFSGIPRQKLLDDAIASGSAHRVRAFFDGFRREAGGAQAQSSSAPSGRKRAAPSGRIYSRDEVSALYSAHHRGAFVGQEAAWAQQEQDIIRAGAEGRIRNPVDVAGK